MTDSSQNTFKNEGSCGEPKEVSAKVSSSVGHESGDDGAIGNEKGGNGGDDMRNSTKQNVRVTRSDPLTSTSKRSHSIRSVHNNGNNCSRNLSHSQSHKLPNSYSKERRARWIRDKMNNYYRQQHLSSNCLEGTDCVCSENDNVPGVRTTFHCYHSPSNRTHGGGKNKIINRQFPSRSAISSGLRRQLTSADSSGIRHVFSPCGNSGNWNESGGGGEASLYNTNWISGNDSKSAKFHRPYSIREQRSWAPPSNSVLLQSVTEEDGGIRQRLCAGHSLPSTVDNARFAFKEGNIHRYFGNNPPGEELTGEIDVTDQNNFNTTRAEEEDEEDEDQEDEDDDCGEEDNKISRLSKSYHFTRQTRPPYPYCLKNNHNLSGGGIRSRNDSVDGVVGISNGIGIGAGEIFSRPIIRSRSQSPCSITSESAESQGEKALDPPRLSVPSGDLGVGSVPGPGLINAGNRGRKLSVLFASYDAWNEENIIHSFKEMSPTATSIFEAAWTGNLPLLEELLQDDTAEHKENLRKIKSSELRDSEGRTPLHLASACGHVPCIELLLAKGAEVNCCDGIENMATPLSCAASCGSVQVVKVLLDHGADVNSGYEQGKTALHWAIQAGSVECAKILLEAGAKQNPPQVYSETPLHICAALGDPICLQLLLDHGADVSLCKGSSRSTALHLSAEEGSAACIRLLLKAGASHSAKDIRGHTALHVAATCDADSVIALLKAGADPNIIDANGRTPLHCAVSRGSRAAECVRLLVESGADIDAQDNYGYTPLHLSAVNESSQCASILLHHGSDVTLKTNAGTNALSLLVRKIPDVMRYLIDRLDSAVTIHDHDPADPDCEIKLDFRAIVPNCEKKVNNLKGKKGNGYANNSSDGGLTELAGGGFGRGNKRDYFSKPHKETEFLTCLVAAGNKKILAHPLSEAFLTLKWRRVRKFFWASLLFQIALVALFTVYVAEVYLNRCPYNRTLYRQKESVPAEALIPEAAAWLPHPGTNLTYNDLTNSREPKSNQFNDNKNDSKHDISRRSAEPQPFSWFSFNPVRNKPTKEKIEMQSSTTTPPPVTTKRNKGRTNNVITRMPGAAGSVNGSSSPSASMPDPKSPPNPSNVEDDNSEAETKIERVSCELTSFLYVIWILLATFASLLAIKEIFQLLQSPLSYVMSSENWGQWLLITSVTMTAWSSPQYLEYWQYPTAACGIFLAWGLMLLQVGRFPALGLYVQMLGKVAANFGLFILAYACLLIAFALSFCVLFPEHPPYKSLPLSILKVFTMMVGEVDYEELFYGDKIEDRSKDPFVFHLTAHLLYGTFVVIVTIVLMNLLVGLAVHDIQGLQKGAKLNRLSRQTALISRLESFIFSKKLQKVLPLSLGSILQKSALLVPSSYNWSFYFRPNDPRDKRLPKEIKQASLRLAAARHSSNKSKSANYHHHHHHSRLHHNHSNGGADILLPPIGGNMSRPISSVSQPHNSRPQTGSGMHHHHHQHPDFVIRRIEQRLDILQSQLDKVLGSLSGRMEAVLDVLLEQKPELQLVLERRQSEIENDHVFVDDGMYLTKSSSVSPSQSDLFRKPSFTTSPSILKDVSCEKG